MKIKNKLTVLFLLLSLVPFFIGGVVSYYTSKKGLVKGIGAKLAGISKNTVDKIDETINERFHDLKIWIKNSVITSEMPTGDKDGKLSAFLIDINDAHPVYFYLDCVNNLGEVIASSRAELIKQKINIDPWLKKALDGRANISDLHKDDLTGEYVISSLYPILSGINKDKIAGVMRAQIKLAGIQRMTEEIRIGEQTNSIDEHIMIIDREGLVLYAPPFEKENIFKLNLVDKKMRSAEEAVGGGNGYLIETTEHDRNSLVGYAHSKGSDDFQGTGWSVLAIQSPELAFKPVADLRNQITVLGLIISIAIILFSVFISKRISVSLESLALSSKSIANGDFSQRIALTSNDEVGELIKSFNTMADVLASREEKLIVMRSELDEKNKILEKVNKELFDNNKYLEYIMQEIHRLLESAVKQKSFKVRFHNPDLGKCWEIKQCNSTKCPSYKNEDQRCWHIAGTMCRGAVQGTFAQKLKDCRNCEIYQKAVSSSLHVIGEVFNDMMDLLEESHHRVEDYAKNLEIKVKERTSELEKAYVDLKNTQFQLVQSGKLAAVGQLAAGVSHELNNPLGGIMGYAQLILEKAKNKNGFENLSPDDLGSIFAYVTYIEKESKRSKDIVSNLLKFAHGTKDAEFSCLDINKILGDTLLFTKHQLDMSKIEINKCLARGLPEISGNAHQLQQVFTNLIVNAQQAMKQGGIITITTRLLDKSIEVSFADTGEGIAEENMDKLFTPFFTTKEIGEGTGLGLSVSYGIVKNHKGEIKVESKLGKGSVFRVILPAG